MIYFLFFLVFGFYDRMGLIALQGISHRYGPRPRSQSNSTKDIRRRLRRRHNRQSDPGRSVFRPLDRDPGTVIVREGV